MSRVRSQVKRRFSSPLLENVLQLHVSMLTCSFRYTSQQWEPTTTTFGGAFGKISTHTSRQNSQTKSHERGKCRCTSRDVITGIRFTRRTELRLLCTIFVAQTVPVVPNEHYVKVLVHNLPTMSPTGLLITFVILELLIFKQTNFSCCELR